jgi:hypothetical protein
MSDTYSYITEYSTVMSITEWDDMCFMLDLIFEDLDCDHLLAVDPIFGDERDDNDREL